MQRDAARLSAIVLGAAFLAGADIQADARAGCTVWDPEICGLGWGSGGADLGPRNGIGMLQVEMHTAARDEVAGAGCTVWDPEICGLESGHQGADHGQHDGIGMLQVVMHDRAWEEPLAGGLARGNMGSHAAARGSLWQDPPSTDPDSQPPLAPVAPAIRGGGLDPGRGGQGPAIASGQYSLARLSVLVGAFARERMAALEVGQRFWQRSIGSVAVIVGMLLALLAMLSCTGLTAVVFSLETFGEDDTPKASLVYKEAPPSSWANLDPVTEGAPIPSHLAPEGAPSPSSQQDGRFPRGAKLSDNLVVPEEHDAVLMVPSLRRLPPAQATASFEITYAAGNAALGVLFSQDPKAGDGDHAVEQVTLRTVDERRTIGFCNIVVPQSPDQARWSQCKVYRWSGEMFGLLESASGPGKGAGVGGTKPALIFTSSDASRLFFYVDPVSGGFVVNDEGSNQVATVERQSEGRPQGLSAVRLAPGADTALVLCCLLAIDRMSPDPWVGPPSTSGNDLTEPGCQ